MTSATELDVREVTVPSALLLQLEGSADNAPGAMASATGDAFARITAAAAKHHLAPAGPPRTTYSSWDEHGTRFAVALPIGAPCADRIDEPGVSITTVPEMSALRFEHRGAYASIASTYGRIDEWLRARHAITTRADWSRYLPMWEEYLNDPATTPESELLTCIYLPLR